MAFSSTALASAGCLLVATLGWLWRRSEAEARRLSRRVAQLEAERLNQQAAAPQVLERAAEDSARAEISAGQPAVPVTLQRPVDDSTARELVLALAAQLEQLEEVNALRVARTLELEEANTQLEAQLATATGARAAALEHERQERKERAKVGAACLPPWSCPSPSLRQPRPSPKPWPEPCPCSGLPDRRPWPCS